MSTLKKKRFDSEVKVRTIFYLTSKTNKDILLGDEFHCLILFNPLNKDSSW